MQAENAALPSMSRASAATFPSCRAKSMASRWSISTMPPPPRSPRRCSTRMMQAMSEDYANVHRGLHYLSNTSTQAFEDARESVRRFLNAPSKDQTHLHPQRHRGDQPRGAVLRRHGDRRGR